MGLSIEPDGLSTAMLIELVYCGPSACNTLDLSSYLRSLRDDFFYSYLLPFLGSLHIVPMIVKSLKIFTLTLKNIVLVISPIFLTVI